MTSNLTTPPSAQEIGKKEQLRSLGIPDDLRQNRGRPKLLWFLIILQAGIIAILLYKTILPVKGSPSKSVSVFDSSSKSGYDNPTQQIDTPPAPKPIVAETDTREFAFESQGFVEARISATVSSRVLGVITHVLVEPGDTVKKGQVLGRLDNILAKRNMLLTKQSLNSLEARKMSAEAELRVTQANLERERAVFDAGYGTQSIYDRLKTNVEVSQSALNTIIADIESVKLRVKQQEMLLSDYVIRAPFDGIVTVKNAQVGEVLAPSGAGGGFTRTGLCTIIDSDSLEVTVDVNEKLITEVFAGQEVRITPYAYSNLNILGKVKQVMPVADRAKGTFQIRIHLEQKDKKVIPGMGVKVKFF